MKLISFLSYVFLVIATIACTPKPVQSQKKNKKEPETEVKTPAPEWVKRKPVDPSYYIGIGTASMRTPDYQQAAKKGALQDLLSEIKVTVSSSSVLFQMDKNNAFKEDYESSIKTTTAGELEDFEVVATHEDGQAYWVYYRLSKSKFASQKRKKQEDATNISLDYYNKALAAEKSGQYLSALDLYSKALLAMKDYWGERIEADVQGQSVPLTTQSYTNIQGILDGITVKPQEPTVTIKKQSSPITTSVRLLYKDGSSLAQFPLTVRPENRNRVLQYLQTNQEGSSTIVLERTMAGRIQVGVDLDKIFNGNPEDKFYSFILKSLRTPSQTILVNAQKPVLYLESSEKNMGKDLGYYVLKDRLKAGLASKGFAFTEDQTRAEIILKLNANTREGSVSQSIHIAYLAISVRAIDASSQNEIYTKALTEVKGFQTSFERAGLDAYKKAGDQVEKQLVNQMVDAMQ